MTEQVERWLPVTGWERYYEISNLGRVRSLPYEQVNPLTGTVSRFPGKVLKAADDKGYWLVSLSRNGIKVNARVHQMVCEAFNGAKPFDRAEIRHLNGDSKDNSPENLKWGTRKENAQDSVRHKTQSNSRKTHCKNGHEFTKDNTYLSRREGYRRCRICTGLNGKKGGR